jgi:ABC-type multidrug transport system ATPase subunit/ABC-type multidrug transport system permease subunit
MANRMQSSKMKVFGSTTYNWEPSITKIPGAYVMQQDLLLPTLTVRETLQCAADLRLPNPKRERRQIVEEVILELGLKDCANTRIGNSSHKGCSGGEKRRVSIGVQMLANPSVLFLDEPTTGLDATSAHQLIRTLKELAQRGRTIIMTIHQPRSEIWSLVDNLILLSKGNTIYSGTADASYQYFEQLGYKRPDFVNPAEFLVDLAAIDNRTPENEQLSSRRVNSLIAAWCYRVAQTDEFTDLTSPRTRRLYTQAPIRPYEASFFRQTAILTKRTFKISYRDPLSMLGTLMEAVFMGFMTGWIFYKMDGSIPGIRSREGALYVASALQAYMITTFEVYKLSIDIQLFDRERGEGVIGVSSFLVSRRLARFLTEDLPVPLVYSTIFYLMAGFRLIPGQFAIFFSIVFILQFVAVHFSMLAIAISRNYATAALIANMVCSMQTLACGFFIQISNMPIYLRWIRYINFAYYAFGALCSNEFGGRFYDCPSHDINAPECIPYTGKFVMKSLGFKEHWILIPILACITIGIVFYIMAGLVLKFRPVQIGITKAVRGEDLQHTFSDNFAEDINLKTLRKVEIQVEEYSVDLQKLNYFGKQQSLTTILKPITTKFEPGVLNVVMGPSGSGKTTLLNSMAQRLKNSSTTKYRQSGRMLFNQALPSAEVVKSLCSYVTQDDDALLPSLTVRETLRFAAGLRLPSHMSIEQKNRRADEVLLKMGLKQCADTLIGNDMAKGISGGEKRRVTIAVQVLTEPRVLLLDEPTSGLDAFTASSILSVLSGLADEGRTVILTIHQSRSDLLAQFGNVILLARGGSIVYSGPRENMLPHFSNLGYNCPTATNPADFVLDLVTVDLQERGREAATREKVNLLIDSWNTQRPPQRPLSRLNAPAELGSMVRALTPFRLAVPLLVRRGALNFRRQPHLIIARIMQIMGLGVLLALFYAPLRNDFYSLQSRLGLIQQIVPIYFIGMLQNVAVYPFERDVAYREMDDGAYTVEAFFLQYSLNEIPLEVVCSFFFSCFADLIVGLPRNWTMFFALTFNSFALLSCGESLGIIFNTFFANTGFAVNIVSLVLAIAIYMSGIMSMNLPTILKYSNYLNPLKYAAANLSVLSLENVEFTCTESQEINGLCPLTTGKEALLLFGLDVNPGTYIGYLAMIMVVYRMLAYIILKAKRSLS